MEGLGGCRNTSCIACLAADATVRTALPRGCARKTGLRMTLILACIGAWRLELARSVHDFERQALALQSSE